MARCTMVLGFCGFSEEFNKERHKGASIWEQENREYCYTSSTSNHANHEIRINISTPSRHIHSIKMQL